MREKYIDEHTGGLWFIFGERGDGTVDVADSRGDVFTSLDRKTADEVIALRDDFMAKLYKRMEGV